MHHDFWHQRWQSNQIGFHLPNVNPLLVTHLPQLAIPQIHGVKPRLLLPLCGKTMDIAWCISQGFDVVGIELSAIAVEALFEQLKLVPTLKNTIDYKIYSSNNITIFQGDFFAISASMIGKVDAVYDRAALVALPHEMRHDYANHLITISACAPQLLISFEYDQSCLSGPPFCVSNEEIDSLYASVYRPETLGRYPVEGGLKGQCEAMEVVWKLTPLQA